MSVLLHASEMVVPYNRLSGYMYYNHLTKELSEKYLSDLVPHPLTQSEIENAQIDTLVLIDRIHQLNAAIDADPGRPFSQNHHDLFLALMEYRLRFCCIFRINDLPEEVLVNIFRLIVWTSPDPECAIAWRLVLTWVCRRWRRIAIADSTIWNSIWFREEAPPFERSFEWFGRAGSVPLDIRIADSPYYKFTADVVGGLMDRLFAKIGQLRVIVVVCEDRMAGQVALEKLMIFARQTDPMILERIDLHNSRTIGGNLILPTGIPLPFIGGARLPRLVHVSLDNVIMDWRHSSFWNLTTLDFRRIPQIHWPNLHYFRSLLRGSPNLSTLCLDAAGPKCLPDEVEGLEPILLPNLKTLVYSNFEPSYALYIAGQINAPHVRDLSLLNFTRGNYTLLFDLITGRFPNLRILTLHSVDVEPSPIMTRWLMSMPELSSLRVLNIQPYFLNFFLCPHPPDSPLAGQKPKGLITARQEEQMFTVPVVCPKLMTLHLDDVDINFAITWVIQRTRMGYPFKRIYISTTLSDQMTEAQHLWLSQFASVFRKELGAVPEDL